MRVKVNDKMQKSYVYWRTKPMGRDFRPGFSPDLTPKQMLALGVFGGRYMTDCRREFPASLFKHAKFSKNGHRASLNYFGVNASQPLGIWRKKGWIYPDCQMTCSATSRCATKEALCASRSILPAAATPGAVALGLRFPKNVSSLDRPIGRGGTQT